MLDKSMEVKLRVFKIWFEQYANNLKRSKRSLTQNQSDDETMSYINIVVYQKTLGSPPGTPLKRMRHTQAKATNILVSFRMELHELLALNKPLILFICTYCDMYVNRTSIKWCCLPFSNVLSKNLEFMRESYRKFEKDDAKRYRK